MASQGCLSPPLHLPRRAPLGLMAMARPAGGELIARHPEFYFPDGSVVIIVESTAFRVHQSVLGRHSEIFNGLWEIPQPKQADTYDGCPTVTLSDSVNDFVDVLRVIYDAFHFDRLKPDASLTQLITFISGILRISTKYHMQLLRNKCIGIIQEKFPSTLPGCDAVLSREIKYIPSEIVRIIPLARETNVPKVLPWAFYLCTHISVDEILSNTVLSWRDKTLCLAGKERLWDAQKVLTHKFLFDFKQSAQCISTCQIRVQNTLHWRDAEALRVGPHPLDEYTDWKSFKVCGKCLEMMGVQHREGRQQVWDRLPNIFQLGTTWDDICKEQSC